MNKLKCALACAVVTLVSTPAAAADDSLFKHFEAVCLRDQLDADVAIAASRALGYRKVDSSAEDLVWAGERKVGARTYSVEVRFVRLDVPWTASKIPLVGCAVVADDRLSADAKAAQAWAGLPPQQEDEVHYVFRQTPSARTVFPDEAQTKDAMLAGEFRVLDTIQSDGETQLSLNGTAK